MIDRIRGGNRSPPPTGGGSQPQQERGRVPADGGRIPRKTDKMTPDQKSRNMCNAFVVGMLELLFLLIIFVGSVSKHEIIPISWVETEVGILISCLG